MRKALRRHERVAALLVPKRVSRLGVVLDVDGALARSSRVDELVSVRNIEHSEELVLETLDAGGAFEESRSLFSALAFLIFWLDAELRPG